MAAIKTDPTLARALEQIAAEDLPALVEEARLRAREEVRAQLTEAIVEAMLGQVPGSVAPLPKPDGPKTPAADETGLYAYCVTPAGVHLPGPLDGVDPRHPPTIVVHGGVAAVVSGVPLSDFDEETLPERLADMTWLERTARRHEAVIEAVAEQATTIPMRLCTVYRGESGVVDMLTRETAPLTEALDRLAGKAEWGVKVFASDGKPSHVGSEPDRGAASGTDYMRRRQSARDERLDRSERLDGATQHIHEHLASFAAGAVICPTQRPEASGHSGPMLLNGAYLVRTPSSQTFLAQVERLQAEYRDEGLELRPTGPWPAYNFVPATIGAAA